MKIKPDTSGSSRGMTTEGYWKPFVVQNRRKKFKPDTSGRDPAIHVNTTLRLLPWTPGFGSEAHQGPAMTVEDDGCLSR